ncbi:MAG: hypothetical protein BV459_01720 [Thermoplasmata archaeon M11B2D]|nr:MAG: hypothetical protein BV459_01720 [Thermoplasmata archaeon M11B2D]PNX50797.1 MAG: hypothetical protein BV458_12570 [Thermoplasmata archaeon M9B2D]
MNVIPLVSVKKGVVYDGREQSASVFSLDTLFTRVERETMLYVLDYDGIEHNNPNFELYQRLAERYILWIDNGPRRLDDVMDTIMAGATTITLRPDLWPDLDMPGVQELTEDEIYLDLSLHYQEQRTLQVPYSGDIGIVLFNDETLYGSFSKQSTSKQKIFLYTDSTEKSRFWDEQGIAGIIIDLQKKQGA